jgi:ABC-type transporter Mla subunit MlaD
VLGRRASVWALDNPVLVGAVTVLVTVIAVFLAYNANNGLPFVPTRKLQLDLPSGDALFRGDFVRVGGTRVGVIRDLSTRLLPSGRVVAVASVQLDHSLGPVPVDSTVTIRPQSALGLKYLDLTIGRSPRTIPDGGTLPVEQVRGEVDLDQVINIFDQPTRSAADANFTEFGNALAGRGADVNATLRQLPATLAPLTGVMRNLAAPATRFDAFFKQLEITAANLAPLAGPFAHLYTTMADTWTAVARDRQGLRDTLSKQPPTLAAGTGSLRVQVPFLRETAALSRDFNVATGELRRALPMLNSATRAATAVTRRSPSLYGKLQSALGALRDLTQAPTTAAALRGATTTIATLEPQLRFLGPYVTVCNYWNYFWDLAGEQFSQPSTTGTSEPSLLNNGPQQQDSLTQAGAATPANGQNVQPNSDPPGTTAPGVKQAAEYLHGAANGAAVTDHGLADCEAGQRGYIHGGQASDKFGPPNYFIEIDAHTPLGYRHGSTYAKLVNGVGVGRGPDRVPPGETFTREPGGSGATPP